jgi:hypothetical protein
MQMTQITDIDTWFDSLHRLARLATGFDDFGDSRYQDPLRRLLRALAADPGFRGPKRASIEQLLIGLLISRQHSEAGWARAPRTLLQPVRAPLFITGLPRTGTTVLHKLLAVDPQLQGLEAWLAGSPTPRPPRATWEQNPQYRMSVWAVERRYQNSPGLRAVHSTAADEVDECFMLLAQDFVSRSFAQLASVPEYDAWLANADFRPAYQRYANNLKLIGGHEPDRRWLLKDPLHLPHVGALLDVFPDAFVVLTHRAPAAAVASACSLTTKLYPPELVEDRQLIGAQVSRFWSEAVAHCEQVRATQDERFIDIDYRQIVADPVGVVRTIYSRCGLELSPQVEQRMAAWLAANPQNKHGQHRYTLADFGLDKAAVEAQFADYLHRHPYLRA